MRSIILKKHCRDERGNWIGLTEDGVLEAMSEYAEFKTKRHKELIDAYIELEGCYNTTLTVDSDIIEKYSRVRKIKAKIELLKIDLEL